jgi:hypothetical protein
MTPREHLELVVRPNMSEMLANLDDLRLAFNAIAAIDALAAHIYWWAAHHRPDAVAGLEDDTEYRAKILAPRSHDFQLVFETAKATKHIRLTRGTPPKVRAADQIVAKASSWDNMRWDDFRWDTTQVRIEPVGGETPWTAEGVLTRALAFLEAEMAALKIP